MTNLLFIFSQNDNFIIRAPSDNLNKISLKFGTPPSVVVKLNHLIENPKLNEILLMRRPKGPLYKVKNGDSLKKLSDFCNMSEEEFLSYNCISAIYPGIIVELYKK